MSRRLVKVITFVWRGLWHWQLTKLATVKTLNCWKGNYEGILEKLWESDWVAEFKNGTLEHNWTFFKNKVSELLKEHVPLKKPYSGKKSAEWMTKETNNLIKTRNETWIKYRQYSSQGNCVRYKQLRNQTWKLHKESHQIIQGKS